MAKDSSREYIFKNEYDLKKLGDLWCTNKSEALK